MGNFSGLCIITGKPIYNIWSFEHYDTPLENSLCLVFHWQNKKPVEWFRGVYNGYGCVDTTYPYEHYVNGMLTPMKPDVSFSGEYWELTNWGEIVSEHYSDLPDNRYSGLVYVRARAYDKFLETHTFEDFVEFVNGRLATGKTSDYDDPEQGDYYPDMDESDYDDWDDDYEFACD